MDSRSAEMSKYAANAMLATKISFINEVARLCEDLNADIGEVRRAISLDRRIGPHFIFPGAGYGGSCFPKDIRAMIGMGGDDPEMVLLKAVEAVNERQKGLLSKKSSATSAPSCPDRPSPVWGLAFKPRTDDMRDAPAITVIEALLAAGAKVQAFDPGGDGRSAKNIRRREFDYAQRSYDALSRRVGFIDSHRMERVSPA